MINKYYFKYFLVFILLLFNYDNSLYAAKDPIASLIKSHISVYSPSQITHKKSPSTKSYSGKKEIIYLKAKNINDGITLYNSSMSLNKSSQTVGFDHYNIESLDYTLPNSVLNKTYTNLPKVLSSYDVKLYYEIFTAQTRGNFRLADDLIAKLKSHVLLGYVYYTRFESKFYKSKPSELKRWLHNYYDLPIAIEIYQMLKLKLGHKKHINARKPLLVSHVRPVYFNSTFDLDNNYLKGSLNNNNPIKKVSPRKSYIGHRLKYYLSKGKSLLAKKILERPSTLRYLGHKSYSYYASKLAKIYFLNGRDSLAKIWGYRSLKYYPQSFPQARFILGLTYWRSGDYKKALSLFQYILKHKRLYSGTMVSKSAYWGARCNLILGNYENYYKLLNFASRDTYGFYGVIASEELGVNPNYNNQKIHVVADDVKYLLGNLHGLRALALLQFGLVQWAGEDLILLAKYDLKKTHKQHKIKLLKGMIYLAQKTPMPLLSVKLAGVWGKYHGLNYLSYPIIKLGNKSLLDPLLTLAVIRQESTFNSRAVSYVGAVGLMQLMPSTAKLLVHKLGYEKKLKSYYNIEKFLFNPNYNVDLGQKYLQLLLSVHNTNNNLIYSLAGWNGGLGNVKKWLKQSFRKGRKDPLFFIESIPFNQTREFVKKVLTNYWVYQISSNIIPTSALDLAKESSPLYVNPNKQYLQNIDITQPNLSTINLTTELQ